MPNRSQARALGLVPFVPRSGVPVLGIGLVVLLAN
jgi:hypothetical protein